MRQYPQIPCDIHNEQATLVLCEQPPLYPQVPQTKIINLSGQLLLPGPDRKVIIERLPQLQIPGLNQIKNSSVSYCRTLVSIL